MHGFGFNVNTDLSYFGHIVPCGISDKAVTSLHTQLGMEIDSIEVKHRIIYHFEKVFDVSIKSCGGIQELKEYFS